MNYLLKKHGLGCMAAALLLISLNSCNSDDHSEQARQPYTLSDSLKRTLVIDTVKIRNISYAIKFNGVVDFNTDKVSNIFPLVSGVVQNIHAMPGDFVKAGEVLGMVKSSEMANYSSSLSSSEAAVRLAKKQLEQQQDLYKSGMASKLDITTAEVNYEQAVAAKTAAQRVLMVNGNNTSGDYFIKSPIDGFLVQKNVTNGMAIRPDNSAPMFTVSNLKNVWVEANVYEENVSKVHEGDDADISTISYPDKIFKGKVNRLMNVIDPNTKVMKMRVIIDNPDFMLKPQMFATVTINNTENDKAISVASSALIFDHSQYYVVVLKGDKNVELRQVEVISTNGKTAFIKSGVNVGERVIASKAILVYGSLNS